MVNEIDFEDIFRYSSEGVLVTDARGLIVHINLKAESMLKLECRLHLGRDLLKLLPDTGALVQKCLKEGKQILGYQVLGRNLELVLNVSLIEKNNRLLGAICTFQEISIFEQISPQNQNYHYLTRQFEAIFHSSSDGLWVCDGIGTVININKASEQLNGIKAGDVVGHNFTDLLEKGIFDYSVTAKVMESKKRETVMQYIAKTRKFLLSTGTPSLDDKGNIVFVVINERDMTELNTLRSEFAQSQKVKAKYQEELSDLALRDLERNSFIADSSKMRNIIQMSLKLSHLGASNILILGDSGTGKGLLAKFIHKNSQRKRKPFVEINCAALPEHLLEAELFGYEKGAFTGASDNGKIGLFELAQTGTLFLDEIGDMPLLLQTKLLKYLDNHEIRRVGGTESINVSCSVVAATNQNLLELVRKKLFREDLYYRLNSFILELPPLKERTDDISGLVRFYLNEFNEKYKCNKTIRAPAIRALSGYSFPGNIRELKSIIENAVVMSEGKQIDEFVRTSIIEERTLSQGLNVAADEGGFDLTRSIENVETQILARAKSRFRTTREMAVALGISQPSVVRKLKKYNIH